ncbi:MAG: discoidin domain-containing protein [Ignavibacteria bacterium]|nr:discoidin domain-containing protein [Ignavibacteria bacterium]
MCKLMVIIFLSWISLSWAQNYYGDKNHSNASDNNPGTESEPWATIQKGIDVDSTPPTAPSNIIAVGGYDVMIAAKTYLTVGDYYVSDVDSLFDLIQNSVPGDTILILAGTYNAYGDWDMNHSGTAGNPIVIAAYGNDIVTLNKNKDWEINKGIGGAPWSERGWIEWHNLILDNQNNCSRAFWLTGSYYKIIGCTLANSNWTMISGNGCSYSTIKGNYIYNYGYNAISFLSRHRYGWMASYNEITFNLISNEGYTNDHFSFNGFPYQGQQETWGESPYFWLTGNKFNYNVCIATEGIYIRYWKDFEVIGNVYINTVNRVSNTAIRTGRYTFSNGRPPDNYPANMKINNNTFVLTDYYTVPIKNWIALPQGEGVDIQNNVFYAHGEVTEPHIKVPNASNADRIYNNLFYTNGKSSSIDVVQHGGTYNVSELNAQSWAGGNIWGDPLFNDLANGQVTVNAGSPLINAGLKLGDFPYYLISREYPFPDYDLGTRGVPTDIGAYELPRGPDLTPPEVTGANLLDSVTLKIMFSEVLDESSAENENNYSISNNIDVFNASLSGSEVTLQTSVHSPDTYTVTIINVTDLAGNTIDPNSNSADYERVEDPPLELTLLEIVDATASVVPESNHNPLKTIDGLGYGDGDPDSRWAGEPIPEWIMFDLGNTYSVSMTKLSFYKYNEGRIYNYSILGSTDASNWQVLLTDVNSSAEEWEIDEFDPVEVRYIRVLYNNSNQNDWAGLWEGQIWGYSPTNINDETQPEGFNLEQNYPNPFNPSTKIKFTISDRVNVVLKVFNLLGQEVADLVNADMDGGVYEIDFDASDLASGVYIYRMIAGNFVDTKKMILLR